MSAELLFDIYTAKSIDPNNTSQVTRCDIMWELATMTDDNSLLEEMLLRKPLGKTLEEKLKEKLSKICMTNNGSGFIAMEKDAFYKCGKYAEV